MPAKAKSRRSSSGMPKATHMSTGAILNRLQRDRSRQKQLILGSGLAVIAILAFIIVLGRGNGEPEEPSPVSMQAEPEVHKVARPPLRSHLSPPPPTPSEIPPPVTPSVSSVRMHVTCSHGVGLWVDNRKYGSCRTLDIDLPPGPHAIQARKGRHVMNENVELDAAVSVRIDGMHRRISVQKLP